MKKLFLATFCLAILGTQVYSQEAEKTIPNGKVFGQVFGDYYMKFAGDTILSGSGEFQKTEKDMNAFNLRRFYLGYEYQINEKFSGKLMFEGNDGTLLDDGGKRGVNVKYAYLQWKDILPGSKLIIGAQSTPTFSRFADKAWGMRYIEKNIVDFRKHGGSNDLGISLSGKINEAGTLNYVVMVGNGRGQKVENDKAKKIYAAINSGLKSSFLWEVYFDYEGDEDDEAATTFKGYVGYQTDKLLVTAEAFSQIQKGVASDGGDLTSTGGTLIGKYAVVEDKATCYVRFDQYWSDFSGDDMEYLERFISTGIDYTPTKNVHVIPNIWVNTYSAEQATVDRKADVVGRLTMAFKF